MNQMKLNQLQQYAQNDLEGIVMQANPHQLTCLLFEHALSALQRARIFIEENRTFEKGRALSKAMNIISQGLRVYLDLEAGGEVAQRLSECYDYMHRRLAMVHLHNDLSILDEIATMLKDLADAWQNTPLPPGMARGKIVF